MIDLQPAAAISTVFVLAPHEIKTKISPVMVAAVAVFVNMTPSPRHVMTHVTDPGLGLVITIYIQLAAFIKQSLT